MNILSFLEAKFKVISIVRCFIKEEFQENNSESSQGERIKKLPDGQNYKMIQSTNNKSKKDIVMIKHETVAKYIKHERLSLNESKGVEYNEYSAALSWPAGD